MSLYEDKHRLFADYLKELDQISPPSAPRSEKSIKSLCDHYISTKDCTWKNLFDPDTKQLVGFIVIGKSGLEKHPDSMRSIAEAYVDPHFRKRGLVTDCLKDYESRHHGVFSLIILKKNEYALHFWNHLFRDMGYVQVPLDEDIVDHTLQDKAILLGFGPK